MTMLDEINHPLKEKYLLENIWQDSFLLGFNYVDDFPC